MNKEDYRNSLEQLFSDRTKLRFLEEDPTNSRLKSLQTFLRTLKKRGGIDEAELKMMFPDNAKIGRAQGIRRKYIRISTGFHH